MRYWMLAAFLLVCGAAGAQSAPPLELRDLQGEMRRLSDQRGKVVLVNFWATWCAPCREEMPSIERLRQSLAGRPFAVLAVNVGESPRTAGAFMDSLPHQFTVLLDRDGRSAKAWGARILPATYVIGPDGAIRYRHFGALDWSSAEARERVSALLP